MKEGTCWLQEVGPEQTLVLLHAFFDAVEHAFPFRRTTSTTWKPVVSSEMLLAHHLSSPGKGEMVQPFPWEDLASVISRVARNMRYEDPTWLLISQDFPHRKMYSLDVPLLHRHDDYRLLERQLGLSTETFSQLTLHRFAT